MLDLNDPLSESRKYRRSPRTIASGSAGMLGFLAGMALTGQIMIWAGCFERGKTPAMEVLDYWPGFLIGGLTVGFGAVFAARKLYDMFHED